MPLNSANNCQALFLIFFFCRKPRGGARCLPIMAEPITASTATVQPDSFLTLHYRLAGAEGDIVNTFAEAPATLQMGSGLLAEALEQRLLGLPEGSHTTFELPAGSVFGEADPSKQQWVPCSEVGEASEQDDKRYVGEVLQFTLPDGQTRVSALVAARDDASNAQQPRVLLDFNHPLAGQALTFEVQIIGIL